jgi:hypothetical protein
VWHLGVLDAGEPDDLVDHHYGAMEEATDKWWPG